MSSEAENERSLRDYEDMVADGALTAAKKEALMALVEASAKVDDAIEERVSQLDGWAKVHAKGGNYSAAAMQQTSAVNMREAQELARKAIAGVIEVRANPQNGGGPSDG